MADPHSKASAEPDFLMPDSYKHLLRCLLRRFDTLASSLAA
jgi:hypothetical protein